MKVTGVLCASDMELAPVLRRMEVAQVTERAMLRFYSGRIGTAHVAAVCSGVCKVNAAVAVQLMIDVFHVDAVVCAGTAGGIRPDVKVLDTVVAEQTAYHDVAGEILTDLHPRMESMYFPAGRELLEAARGCAESWERPVLFGTVMTGERFVTGERRERINQRFAPLAVDMESAAAAHVCYVNRVPFLAVRSISDDAANDGVRSFEENCEQAAELAAEFTAALLKRYWGAGTGDGEET